MVLKNSLFALTAALVFCAGAPARADTWTVAPDQSTLGFQVQQGDAPLTGSFADWTATIDFDPEAPEGAVITATIAPASATTGNPQFDATLPAKDWFNADAFPAAEFKADGATLVEGNSYRAAGTLTIKGISQPVNLDFTLDIEGDTATAKGTATLERLAYELGTGVGEDTVGNMVTVTLDLTATR